MPSLIQSSFGAGEIAPEYHGQSELPVYKTALRRARNMVVTPQGAITARPGFRDVASAKNGPTTPVKLVRFTPGNPSSPGAYMLEFGPGYIRFFRKRAPVLSGGNPFEVVTPFVAGDLAGLNFTRAQYQLYIWSGTQPTQVLTWTGLSDTGFSLATAIFTDGPYRDINTTATTLTPQTSGASTATVVASGITGINNNTGFSVSASDVGRLIRVQQQSYGLTSFGAIGAAGAGYHVGDTVTFPIGIYDIRAAVGTVTAVGAGGAITGGVITDPGQYQVVPANPVAPAKTSGMGAGFTINLGFSLQSDPTQNLWAWGSITAVNSTTSIAVALQMMTLDALGRQVQGIFISNVAVQQWRLGAWCGFEGYPVRGGARFQRRLLAASTAGDSKRLWGSETAKPLSMAPSLATGQVIDSNAISFTLDDDEASLISWISPAGNAQQPEIGVGGDAEFIVAPTSGQALTATNVQAYLETKYGSSPVQPLRIGKALLFVDGAGRLRRWLYRWMAGGMIGPEASPFGRHLLNTGLKAIDYAQSPHQVIWAVTNDGQLLGLTYVADADDINGNVQLAAWHAHPLGGTWYGQPPLLHSMAIVPSEDFTIYSEIWIAVDRVDLGGSTRRIEVSTPYFKALPLDQAMFLDGAISSPLTFPNMTCTPVGGPFSPSGNALLPARGDTANFTLSSPLAVAGDLIPGTILRINNGTFRLMTIASTTSIGTECLDPPRSLAWQNQFFWSYTPMATSFAGFAAQNGRSVAVIGDGAYYGTQVVSGGLIVLPAGAAASYVTAGYPYTPTLETLDLDLPSPDGTSQMKTGRLDHLYLRVFETLGGEAGPDDSHLDKIPELQGSDLADWPAPLVSDDVILPVPGGSSRHRRIVIRQPYPWPITVQALVVKGDTNEKAMPGR